MRPARRTPCSKLIYVGSAIMRAAIGAEALRQCQLASTALALLLSMRLGATAQSVSQEIPRAVTKSADIDRRAIDSEARINSLIRKMTLSEKLGQFQQVNNVDVENQATANHRATSDVLRERIRQGH